MSFALGQGKTVLPNLNDDRELPWTVFNVGI